MSLRDFYGLSVIIFLAGCSFTQKVKTGEQAYEYKQYSLATELLSAEYQQTPGQRERAQKAFLLGKSYQNMNEPALAAEWFEVAFDNNFGEEALRMYAEQLRQNERYEEALEAYQRLLTIDQQSQRYRRMVTICQQAIEWAKEEGNSPYQVFPLGINTPASEYAAFVIGSDELIFSSDRPESMGEEPYNWTGREFSDLYFANISVNNVEKFDENINTRHNEGTLSFSSNQAELYFVRCFSGREYDSYCKIMYSRYTGKSWTEPEQLPFIKPEVNYGSPFIAGGDSVLYFSCNDPEGMGGYDIYRALRIGEEWQQPEILSDRINTIGNEKFPTLDGDTLYFSSDELVGMGGLDIFKTYPLGSAVWAPPENLKPPVNSGGDDFYLMVDPFAQLRGTEVQKGFLSSSRPGGSGGDDLYSFEKHTIESIEAVVETETGEEQPEEALNYQIFLAVKVVEPVFAIDGDPNSNRTGKKSLKNARVEIEEGPLSQIFTTDANGLVIFEMDFETQYQIIGKYPNYLTARKDFSTVGIEINSENPVKTFNMELVLEPIFKDREIVLENIYYDYDQWFIRDDAKPTLDSLSHILKVNPDISIQMSSHTDCRGNDEYNTELSQKRAQSAVEYLISQGIAGERLSAKGYGESQPSILCVCETCSEEEHQANRRTTFKIID